MEVPLPPIGTATGKEISQLGGVIALGAAGFLCVAGSVVAVRVDGSSSVRGPAPPPAGGAAQAGGQGTNPGGAAGVAADAGGGLGGAEAGGAGEGGPGAGGRGARSGPPARAPATPLRQRNPRLA